jgi:hypothetical protein
VSEGASAITSSMCTPSAPVWARKLVTLSIQRCWYAELPKSAMYAPYALFMT